MTATLDDTDIFLTYAPPFDLTSDMLFACALCPTAWLRQAFPQTPFLSVLGRTPLAMWFCRVKEIVYRKPEGGAGVLGGPDAALYHELTVVTIAPGQGFFVPDIIATSELSYRIGHRYGMPKRQRPMSFTLKGTQITSCAEDDERSSEVTTQLWGTGRIPGRMLNRLWPRDLWPVRFPSGSVVYPRILATPRIQPARLRSGRLHLNRNWMPRPLALLPFGIYAPNLQMRLPPPER